MGKVLRIILTVLLIGICPALSVAETNETEEIISLKEAIRKNPTATWAHTNLSAAYLDMNRYQEAIAEGKEAIRLDPNNYLAHNNLGAAYANSKRRAEAILEFKEAIRIDPNHALAHMNLSKSYFALDHFEEFLKEHKEAIRLDPNLPISHVNLGIAYDKLKRYDEAILEFRDAILLDPNDATLHTHLGLLYDAIGNGAGAIIEVSTALRLREKEGNLERTAFCRKFLRMLYATYHYKTEDFANIETPSPALTKPPIKIDPSEFQLLDGWEPVDNGSMAGKQAKTSQPNATTIFTRSVSYGTGVLFNQVTYLFTNYHVVRNAKNIKVKFVNGETIQASVSYADESNDIAMLNLAKSPTIQLKHISLADVSKVKVGEKVFTIGYPASHILGKEPKYSEGVVNSLSGAGDDAKMFQISVPIQAGNSGGPLFNERGEVIGMITSTFVTNEALLLSGTMPQNVNFAVKSSLFADKALVQSKGIATTSIVPVPTPLSVSDFVAGVKNNIVLIEVE